MKERASAPVFTRFNDRNNTNDQDGGPGMVDLGIDLHRKHSVVAALAEDGGVLFSRRIESRPEAFGRIFGELEPGPLSVVFEATYGWYWLADLLKDAGIEAHMAHPLATKAIAAGRVKNDSVDARALAHLLRTHLLPARPFSTQSCECGGQAALNPTSNAQVIQSHEIEFEARSRALQRDSQSRLGSGAATHGIR